MPRRGLPDSVAMRHDEHYVEALAASAGAPIGRLIPIDLIDPNPDQPRKFFSEDALTELAASMTEHGVLQPILVSANADGTYEIIAGERRWLAASRAGLHEVPALVRSVPDQAALALALIENIQRENLNPLEEAHGVRRLIDDFGLTHEAAAQAVGRSRSAVSNLLRLTHLAKPVQERLLAGEIDMGHARALLALPAAHQVGAAAKIIAQGLSVRDTERLVHASMHQAPRGKKRGAGTSRDGDLARLEEELAQTLGATVRIEASRKGSGRIVIAYSSLDQLEGILVKLR